MRYYYKSKDGKGYLSLKTPLSAEEAKDYIEITEEQWNAHMESIQPKKPTAEELVKREKLHTISEKKAYLRDTDYVVIKIAEAETKEEADAIREEYVDVIALRKQARVDINRLEKELEDK